MIQASSACVLAVALAGFAATAMAQAPGGIKATDGAFTDARGMTLYTFDKDSAGKSACNAGCAAMWPPLKVEGDTKPSAEWSVLTRDDGSKQWAYEGKPLYTWVKDQKPGDRTGDNFNNAWHVARP